MKDFDKWNILKKNIDNKKINLYFKEREIWFCYFGCNVGFEQDGKGDNFLRPVLILKKFNKNLFLGIPLTSKIKENKFYYKIILNNKKQCLILSQIKIIDIKRLKNKRYIISDDEFKKVKTALITLMS